MQKRPPPPDQILKPGFKVDERGKIVRSSPFKSKLQQRMRPISEEDKKAIKAFQELMKLTPAEREKIRKDKWEEEQKKIEEKKKKKQMIKEYILRNTWVANAGKTPEKKELKF